MGDFAAADFGSQVLDPGRRLRSDVDVKGGSASSCCEELDRIHSENESRN